MPVSSITPNPAMPPSEMISSPNNMNQVDFLQMLTAQMRSQDPMNPMNGENFAAQLAQFSSLQELQGMGATMGQTLQADLMLARSFNNTMAASLIGKTVRAEMDNFSLRESGEVTLSYKLPSSATEITVDVKDSEGTVVRTMHVNPQAAGEHTATWDGMNSEGHRAAPGNYTYNVTAKDASGNDVPVTTYLEGRVTEVRYVDGNAVLTVNGLEIQLGQVMSISEPEATSDLRRG